MFNHRFKSLPAYRQAGNLSLLLKGRFEKIDSVLFQVIPAKAGIQCFHDVTN